MSQQGRLVDAPSDLETLTGNIGGAVPPDGAGNTNIIGSGGITTSGNPGTNTITITPDGTLATSYDTDSGSAIPATDIINILGGTGISTSGAGNTVTINSDGTLATTYDTDSGSATPAANTINIVGSAGISTSGAGDTVTITLTGGGFTWTEILTTSTTMAVENGYVANNAALVTLTLPATAAFGEAVQIVGKGAGLFKIAQNAGQTIHFIDTDTTTGVGGSLTAIEQYAALELVCITANTDFAVIDSTGNFTIV